MRFLDRYFDPVLDVDVSVSEESIVAEEIERLQRMTAEAMVACQIPRRLSDASREELALDKKRSRRIAHVLRQNLAGWGGALIDPSLEQRQAGAQVHWESWWGDHQPWLEARMRLVASWAKKSGNLSVGKKLLTRLSNELEWLKYALRD